MKKALTLLLALTLLALAVLGGDFYIYRDSIHPGVEVWARSPAGLSPAEARVVIQEEIDSHLRKPFTVSDGEGERWTFTPADSGIAPDVQATYEDCLAAGAQGPLLRRLTDILSLWGGGKGIPPSLTIDPLRWRTSADNAALAFERLAKDATLALIDGETKVIAAHAGVALDRGQLLERIRQALAGRRSTVRAPLSTIEPEVTTADAQAALNTAERIFSSPLLLTYQGQEFKVSREELVEMAEIDPSGLPVGRPVTFETEAARDLLARRLSGIERSAVDAQVVPADPAEAPTSGQESQAEKGYTVTPSRKGTVIQWEVLLSSLLRVAASPGRREVPISTTTADPELTTRDAKLLAERRQIASFTTYFNSSDRARAGNIRQVAQIVDGTVIRPGETFSFNEVTGPRTKAAGFDEAPVIRGGVLTPGVGGGICQVSTTLFNAAFFAGLPIVERQPHSFFIDHYPIGRDATVSYGSVDFKFRNDSEQVILVTAKATDHSVTVSLAAPEWDRVVEYDTGDFRDIKKPASTADNPRRLHDPSLEPGEESSLEPGVNGLTVEVERVVRDEGGEMLLEDVFRSEYSPKEYVVRVGK